MTDKNDPIRPPRAITLGRRKSDRWLAYTCVFLMVAMALFIVYTSWQQNLNNSRAEHSEAQREMIITELRRQNDGLVCFASTTLAFEQGVIDYLAAQSQGDTAKARASAEVMLDLKERLDVLEILPAEGQPVCPVP
jgi:hypothetical protein